MIGETLDRKYKLLRLLGQGGMASVYEAEHQGTRRRVAVKVIDSRLLVDGGDAIRRFRREARAASAIDSDHIVQVLDAGTDEATSRLYLVMEHLQGEDLQQLLDRAGPLPPDVALRIAAQALVGLQRAHEANIIHRDIKPANLFLARREDSGITVKLLDFGIAKIIADPLRQLQTMKLTATSGLLGSPLYMSPEQVLDSGLVDHRTDLWSLGSVLYCALAGHAPHEPIQSVGRLLIAICASPPTPLHQVAPGIAPEISDIVQRALELKPAARYPSAAAMIEAMSALLPRGFEISAGMLAFAGATPGAVRPGEPSPRAGSAKLGIYVRLDATGTLEDRRAAVTQDDAAAPFADTFESGDSHDKKGPAAVELEIAPAENSSGDPALLAAVPASQRGDAGPAVGTSRRPIPRVLLGALLFLAGIGVATAWRGVARTAQPEAAAPALAPTPPAPEAPAPAPPPRPDAADTASPVRRVRLVVIPKDASVEVDGARVRVQDGVVLMEGLIGSHRRVRVSREGYEDLVDEVAVTEEGAIPTSVELRRQVKARPTTARAHASTPAPASASPAAPRPPHKGEDEILRTYD